MTPGEAGPDNAGPDNAGPGEQVYVDARGLRCPLPVIRAAARARELAPGTVLAVSSTDPASEYDLPAWARMRGHELVALSCADGEITATIRLR